MVTPELQTLLAVLRRDVRGFPGRFLFEAEHTVDRGIGNVADFVEIDDRLVYVDVDADVTEPDEDDVYVIAEPLDPNVGEPIARMLNAIPELLAYIEKLETKLREFSDVPPTVQG